MAEYSDDKKMMMAAVRPTAIGGSTTSLTTDAVALGVDTASVMVLVQADVANAGTMLLGGSSAQPIQLLAGQYLILPISNVNKLYVKMATGTGTANYLILA